MSTNLSSYKPNYKPSANRQRKSVSPSNYKLMQKSKYDRSFLKDQLPTTQAKRRNQNEQQQYIGHIPKSLYQQQRTNKKSHGISPYRIQTSLMPSATSMSYSPQNKIQMLKQQNVLLMNENKYYVELLNQRNQIIQNLQKKLQFQIQQQVLTLEQIQKQKNRFLDQFHVQDVENKAKIQSLVLEIKKLTQNYYTLQKSKNHQIQCLKHQFYQENRNLVDNVISKNQRAIQSQQTQINQLNAQIQRLNDQLYRSQQNYKLQSTRYTNQIQRLVEQIQTLNHQKKIQLSQQKIAYDNIISQIKRESQHNIANTIFKYDVQMRKIKNLLNQKQLQQGNLQQLIQNAKLQHSNQLQTLLQRDSILKNQIFQLQIFYKATHKSQIQKQKRINHHQHQLLLHSNQLEINGMREEINQLLLINQNKSDQIDRLYAEIQKLRENSHEQIERMNKINEELKNKIAEINKQNQEELELLKIKISELRSTDLTSLKTYYENQIAIKSQQIIDLDKMVQQNRVKLHKQLQQRVVEKKKYEYIVDQLRIRITQMQLKMATMVQQHKQKIHSIGSQMQLTSMTLIRQASQKQKYSNSSQLQKKRLQNMIQQKDQQILQLNRLIKIIKQNQTQQVQSKIKQINLLNEKNQQLLNEIKRQREFYQKQINKKQQLKKQTKDFYQNQLLKQKQNYSRQLNELMERISKEKKDLVIETERLKHIEKQLKQELSRYSENQQQRSLQRDITHNQEKSRLQYSKQSLEINLKNYYQKKLTDVQEQLNITKQQLTQKIADLRALNEKYYKLQKKLDKLMESQEKLRQFEERVLAIGQENNIVKNLSDVIKSKKKVL